ncbi:outer membrane beta-barrel protein [Roseivirga thermotolerans]|uniref:outer membrane beta-barrel protein n=1 Tax=Roseivirga thermotolerans TaxID=1758176 RepID=UPI00273E899E|nr:outer membrane beta-barrel protein [Roseivirga thermotolerans]
MKKFALAIVVLFMLGNVAKAQRPDLPGALIIDVGVNNWTDAPDNLRLNNFESKTVNITYYYDLPIGNSKFTFTPGLGLGLEKFSLKDNYTLTSSLDNTGNLVVAPAQLTNQLSNVFEFGKSKFAANYVDIPLEIRFYKRKNQYSRGLRAALGGKVGLLYSSFTKYKWEDTTGENHMVKNRADYGLTRFRYGVQGRVGFGGFSLFGYYELSDKFDVAPAGGENTRNFTFGVSLTGF